MYSLKAWCLTDKTDSSFTLMKGKDLVASSKRPDRTDSAFLKFENTLEVFNISLNVGINENISHSRMNIHLPSSKFIMNSLLVIILAVF